MFCQEYQSFILLRYINTICRILGNLHYVTLDAHVSKLGEGINGFDHFANAKRTSTSSTLGLKAQNRSSSEFGHHEELILQNMLMA